MYDTHDYVHSCLNLNEIYNSHQRYSSQHYVVFYMTQHLGFKQIIVNNYEISLIKSQKSKTSINVPFIVRK